MAARSAHVAAVLLCASGCLTQESYSNADVSGSSLSSASLYVLADGQDTARVQASVRTGEGQPIPGLQVTFLADASSIVQPTAPTDANGLAWGLIASQSEGQHQVRMRVQQHDFVQTLSPNLLLHFVSPTGTPTVVVNTPVDVPLLVQRPDGSGQDGDFAGAVTFTSSDARAQLPPPAVLTAADAGYKLLAGALVFHSTGLQLVHGLDATGATVFTQAYQVNAGPAARLVLQTDPGPWTAGSAHSVQVSAVDAAGNLVKQFTDRVALVASDANASLPDPVTFTADDAGVHTFPGFAFNAAGTQTLQAQDVQAPLVTSAATPILVSADGATVLQITLSPNAVAGVATAFTVQAYDSLGNPATGYAGSAAVSSDDPQAQLPATVTLGAGGAGSGSATFRTAGLHALSLTGTVSGSRLVTVAPGPTDHLAVDGLPASLTAGTPQTLTVRAVDAFNNTVSAYLGVVGVRSSDAGATLPATVNYSQADQGQHAFTVTLTTAGTQSVTFTDAVTHIVGSVSASVQANLVAGLQLTGLPAQSVAGSSNTPTVRAVDAYGNTASAYQGRVHFASTDPRATLPPDTSFASADAGLKSWPAGASLLTAGTQTVSVTDDGGLTANQNNLTVTAAAAAQLQFVSAPPQNANACAPFAVQVQVLDASGNAVAWAQPVSVSLQGGAGFTLQGNSVRTPSGATVAFAGLSIAGAGNGNPALLAQSPGLASAQSAAVHVQALPATLSLGAPAGTSGSIAFAYTVQAACPVSLEFAVSPAGNGVYQPATALPGTTCAVNLPAATAQAGAFVWDSARDLPRTSSSTATFKVTARSAGTTVSAQRAAISVQNGTAYAAAVSTATSAAQSCMAYADLNHDGVADLITCDTANNRLQRRLGALDGSFGAAVASAAGTGPSSLATADVNRDGNVDVVATNPGANTVSVLLGDGAGGFGAASTNNLGTNPVGVALADLNHDGILDFIAANGSSGQLTWALGTGTGAVGTASALAAGTGPVALAVADLDNDGKPDAVVANSGSSSLSLFFGTGSGFAAASSVGVGSAPLGLALGDLNLDGQPDVLVAQASRVLPVYLSARTGALGTAVPVANVLGVAVGDVNNDGALDAVASTSTSGSGLALLYGQSGALAAPVALPTPAAVRAALVGDINHDGRADVLTLDSAASFSLIAGSTPRSAGRGVNAFAVTTLPQTIGIGATGDFTNDGKLDFFAVANSGNLGALLVGDGAGVLTQTGTWPLGGNTPSAVAADFDGDGNLDVALPSFVNATVYVLLGDGAGHFSSRVSPYVGSGAQAAAVADVNEDGKPDLLVTVVNAAQVVVLLNNGQGTFTVGARLAVDANPVSIGVADLNGDGHVDIVTNNAATSSANTLFGDGTGNFTGLLRSAGLVGERLCLGDFDGDGHLDALTNNGGSVYVAYGDATGKFTSSSYLAGGGWTNDVDVADFNRDGKADAVMPGTVITVSYGNSSRSTSATAAAGTFHAVRAGDFNGDGWPDMVLTHEWSSGVKVALNDGTGHFGQPRSTTGNGPDTALCDLNHDGLLDTMTVYGGTTGPPLLTMSIGASYGTGAGVFASGSTWYPANSDTGADRIAAGDLNGDGWQDMVTVDRWDGAVTGWLNDGAGNFARTSRLTLSNPLDLALADFNRDGKLDLAVAQTSGPVFVGMGNGDGTFGSLTAYTPNTLGNFRVGDVDNNGTPDLVAAVTDGAIVKRIDGSGNPVGGTAANASLSFPGTSSVSVVDVNSDGKLDVVAPVSGGALQAALGDGTGAFAAPAQVLAAPGGDRYYDAAMGDVNADGQPDLVISSDYFGDVIVALGQGNGVFGAPTVLMANGIRMGHVWVLDFNHDGLTDVLAAVRDLSGGNGWGVSVLLGR